MMFALRMTSLSPALALNMIGKVVGMLAGVENDGGKKRSKREEKWRKEFMQKKRKEHIDLIASKFPNVAPEIIAEALDSASAMKQAAMSLKAQLSAHGGAGHGTTLEQARKNNFSQYIVPTERQRSWPRPTIWTLRPMFRQQGDAQRARARHGRSSKKCSGNVLRAVRVRLRVRGPTRAIAAGARRRQPTTARQLVQAG